MATTCITKSATYMSSWSLYEKSSEFTVLCVCMVKVWFVSVYG